MENTIEKRVLEYLNGGTNIRENRKRTLYYESWSKPIGYFDDIKRYDIITEKMELFEFKEDEDLGTCDFSDFLCLKTNAKRNYTLQIHTTEKFELSFLLEKDGFYYYIDKNKDGPYSRLENIGTNRTDFIFFTPVNKEVEQEEVELYILYEKCVDFSSVKVS